MKSKQIIAIICLPIIIFLSSCQAPSKGPNSEPSEKSAQLLGTFITATAYGDKAAHALELAFKRVQEIEDKMSRFQIGSEIDLINQNAGIKPTEISQDTFSLIQRSLDYAAKTKGAFNPLIGQLVDLWGIGTPEAKLPSQLELNEILPLDYTQLKLTQDPYTATLSSSLVKLDLGAIAKGYAADEMKKILIEEGITTALLNLGGNVIVMGSKPSGDLWTIGVQHPLAENRGEIAGVIRAKDTSVVTSGSYERFFESGGTRYHHIMDPFTGFPAENGVISSTIITPNSADADALSTSIYIMGKDAGLALIESLPDTEAIIITDECLVYRTSGITDDTFELRSEDFTY